MNATKIVSGGSTGAALGAGIVYVLGRVGVVLTPEDGALASVALVAVCAFIAHNGIAGAFTLIWRGEPKQPPLLPPGE